MPIKEDGLHFSLTTSPPLSSHILPYYILPTWRLASLSSSSSLANNFIIIQFSFLTIFIFESDDSLPLTSAMPKIVQDFPCRSDARGFPAL